MSQVRGLSVYSNTSLSLGTLTLNRKSLIGQVTLESATDGAAIAVAAAAVGTREDWTAGDSTGFLSYAGVRQGTGNRQETGTLTVSGIAGDPTATLQSKYFLLSDAASDGQVAFWINVESGGTEPVHGADRAVEITTINSSDTTNALVVSLELMVVISTARSAPWTGSVPPDSTLIQNATWPSLAASDSRKYLLCKVAVGSPAMPLTVSVPVSCRLPVP